MLSYSTEIIPKPNDRFDLLYHFKFNFKPSWGIFSFQAGWGYQGIC